MSKLKCWKPIFLIQYTSPTPHTFVALWFIASYKHALSIFEIMRNFTDFNSIILVSGQPTFPNSGEDFNSWWEKSVIFMTNLSNPDLCLAESVCYNFIFLSRIFLYVNKRRNNRSLESWQSTEALTCLFAHTHTPTHTLSPTDENSFLHKRLSRFNHCYYSNHDDMFLNGLLYVCINNKLSGKDFWRAGWWWAHAHTHALSENQALS